MAGFENLNRQTLADTVYSQMRNAILAGDIGDGEELNQVALAQQFNVSRVPVREALRRLQAERLVTATPYQQYIVSAVKVEALLELIEIREELEAFAVRRRIPQLTADVIREMKQLNGRMRKEQDKTVWLTGDVELHELIDGPGTETARMVLDLRSRVHRYLRTVASTRTRQRQACNEHDRIISAMAAGDADAAELAMREHIRHTQSVIADYLHKSTGSSDGGATIGAKKPGASQEPVPQAPVP